MTTFDQILPLTTEVLKMHKDQIADLDWLVINRDLNGRVRFIAPEVSEDRARLETVYQQLSQRLGSHAHNSESGILYETDLAPVLEGATSFELVDFKNVWIVDRLATDANWAHISPENTNITRIVFFSIKGGVGRSTALAATAWSLAQSGKRVLLLDLDLESPGLSSALLPAERQPTYGITDWLVEDLVNNGDAVFDSMVATSNLSHDGEIHIVPAHGAKHGEYIAKLGRVWMSKLQANGTREAWFKRLARLLDALEERIRPDVVLIDSRSGIDEIASACITELGANLILLFALEGEQTWNGHRMLFEQWQRAQVAELVRERLKVVAAIVPEKDRVAYLEGLRENAYRTFAETLYDEIMPANPNAIGSTEGKWRVGEVVEGWNFDEADEGAPHYPWAVHWQGSFAGLRSLHGRLATIDAQEVQSTFGPLISGIRDLLEIRR